MNIDDQIAAKQKEMQDNQDWISKSEFLGEVTPGQSIKINSSKDLIFYSIHSKKEELLIAEYELLLDKKYPHNARGDHEKIERIVSSLHDEIEELEKLLER